MSVFRVLILFCFSASLTQAATRTSTTTGGNWTSASTWTSGIVPTSSDDVIINGDVTLDMNATCITVTINSGKKLNFSTGGGYTLTLTRSNNTALTNNGTFNANDGTVKFTGAGGKVSGTINFNIVILDGATQFNFGTASTINNKLSVTNNGYLATNYPSYASSASLEINGSYSLSGNYYLWPNSSGATMPNNISVVAGTQTFSQLTLNIKGAFTVANGATVNALNSCFILNPGFTGFTSTGTLNLGGIDVLSGATWSLITNRTINNLNIRSGATVNVNSYILTITYSNTGGTCSNNSLINLATGGTFNAGTGTVVLDPDGNQPLTGNIIFNNLVVTGGDVKVNGSATVTVNGNLSVSTNGRFEYGNAINTGAVVIAEGGSVTNAGGTTSNITNGSGNTVTVDNSITTLAASTNGGGIFTGPRQITAPSVYELTSDILINAPGRKVLIINPGAELIANIKSITADSIYVYGKLTLSHAAGLNTFLGSTKIFFGPASTIEFKSNSNQTINAGYTYNNLHLTGTGNKTTAVGTYTITGNFTQLGGSITLNSATAFVFSGSKNQSVLGLPYNAPTFSGSGNKTLTDTAKVTGIVTISGSANLVSNGLLTLTSTATGTASIGSLTGSATITGNINYERYIPAGRLWRFIGWPISGSSVANSWQKQIYVSGPGTGGGSLGTTNSNGFDWTSTNEASVFTYNESATGNMNSKWTTIPNTSTSISPTKGYRVFIRGDRAQGTVLLNGSTYTPQAVTLKGSGLPNKGDIPVSITCSNGCTSGDGWNFIANPYPSAIDWNNASWATTRGSSVSATVHIYNPATNNYSAWNATGGSVNGGSNIIASGQAFWVKANGNSTLTFKEAYKATPTNAGLFGKNETELSNNLKIQLGDSSKVFDEAVVYMYANATHDLDGDLDALKASVANATISTYTTTVSDKLVFNAIAELKSLETDTILLHTPLANANYNYRLTFQGIFSFTDETTRLMLLDAYTGGMIDLNSGNSYDFATTKNNGATYAANRFTLVITTGPSTPLPVSLLSFSGKKVDQTVVLDWKTASERMNERFDIQHSTDGIEFQTIGTQKGALNSNKLIRYFFTDHNPKKGINYYRLKQVNTDQTFVFSPVVGINFNINQTATQAVVYPTMATTDLTLELHNSVPTHVTIKMVNTFGQVVSTLQVDASESNYVLPIDISSYKPGIYFLTIKDINGTEQAIKFLKEAQ